MTGKTGRGGVGRGNLELMVLSALAEEPQYGYLITQQLAEASGNLIRLQAGTLYPLLHRLEAEKLIRSKWDRAGGRRRKWYELTAAGRKRLSARAREWEQVADCLRRLLEPVLGASPGTAH